jgi:hypothetical protein
LLIEKERWGEFVHPIAVCETCRMVVKTSLVADYGYEVEFDFDEYNEHEHQLSFLVLRRDQEGRRSYEIKPGASPALLNILRWAGELWLGGTVDVRRDVSDVCLYIRQRLYEI